jgi:hypothetical protein
MLVGLHLDEEVAMLGDKLGNVKGKIVLRRVLPGGSGGPRIESSQRGSGTVLGVEFQENSTYESELRSDGTIFGSGQGIYFGQGGEIATWVGSGVGIMSPGGSVTFRGAIYLYSAAPSWKRLNAVAAVFEYAVDADDNYTNTLAEWK